MGQFRMSRMDLLEHCYSSTIEWKGTRMAFDARYEVVLDGKVVGSFYSSPGMIEEAVMGYLAYRGESKSAVSVEEVRKNDDLDFTVMVKRSGPAEPPGWRDAPLRWELLMELVSDLSRSLSKSRCPFAFHIAGLYLLAGERLKRRIVLVDVSRHTAMMKLAGWILLRSSSLGGMTPVVISTGRLSSDAVEMMAISGVNLVASFRHVLASGVVAADRLGITLVSKDFTRKMKVFTHPWRLKGAPLAAKGGPSIEWSGKRADQPVC